MGQGTSLSLGIPDLSFLYGNPSAPEGMDPAWNPWRLMATPPSEEEPPIADPDDVLKGTIAEDPGVARARRQYEERRRQEEAERNTGRTILDEFDEWDGYGFAPSFAEALDAYVAPSAQASFPAPHRSLGVELNGPRRRCHFPFSSSMARPLGSFGGFRIRA